MKETHRATVKDNNDPEKRGRLLVASATLMGVDSNGEAVDYPNFIEPVFPILFSSNGDKVDGGWFGVPSVGAMVEIEVSTNSVFDQVPGQTEQTDPDPRWKSCVLRSGDDVASEFKTNYPKRMGYKTESGHTLIFDDAKDGIGGKVMLTHRSGMQIRMSNSGIEIGLSPGGPELLDILSQFFDAVDAFSLATTAAVIEPTLGASAAQLNLKSKQVKLLLNQIRVK